jgi:hypothetical protein
MKTDFYHSYQYVAKHIAATIFDSIFKVKTSLGAPHTFYSRAGN